mmetsp:Transcript_26795/g.46482  ORF Transcript_26795/g.46482 Transcript_26795/m.46482 type:complete len:530 (+) Transcript_26795:137-1726(+)
MYMVPGSVSTEILGVVGGFSEMERNVDSHSQTLLVLFTSFTFLIPAFASWRMARIWHACLFGMMAIVCASYHFCSADMPQQLGMHARCSPTATKLLTHAFFMWVYFTFLQMAFLVLGPEDPHMQWLANQATPNGPVSCTTHSHAPTDAILIARVAPAIVLCLFHFAHASWDSEEVQWQSLLLNELLLLSCSIIFWMHPSRQGRAADVLIRFRYWHRLLHHGFIPAMMLFWIFCIMGFADFQALHSMWHVVVAFFAISLLRTVLFGDSSSPSARVFDLTPHNPNVAHVLLGSVALIVLPTAVIGASFDWCSTSASHWPTISSATQCQPGGYFVAIVSVPAFTGVATVFWLIDSTASSKTPWFQFHSAAKPWELQEPTLDSHQLALGKRLGCVLGYAAAAFGLVAALIMKGTPIQNVLNLFFSIVSLGLLMIAMSLTVISSDPSTRSFRFRRGFTMLVCLPVMLIHMMLILAEQCIPSHYEMPHSLYAMTEYLVVILLTVWPMTWALEVQDTWQRNTSGSFAWPVTPWRFV